MLHRVSAEGCKKGQGERSALDRIPLCANPELRISEGRTYANSPPTVPRFACDLSGAKPQPMADPFDAVRIEMGDGIASPKPSTTNVCRWIASRSTTPCRPPVPRGRGWIARGGALAGRADRRTCRCRSLPGLPMANRRCVPPLSRPPRGWGDWWNASASPCLNHLADGLGRAVFSPPAPAVRTRTAIWGAGLREKDG